MASKVYTVSTTTLTVGPLGVTPIPLTCNHGDTVLTGGYYINPPTGSAYATVSQPLPGNTGWMVDFTNTSPINSAQVSAYANCFSNG